MLVAVKAAGINPGEAKIAATFPLAQVREAYELLAKDHIRGKIVLLP